jgi:hypothetical protein
MLFLSFPRLQIYIATNADCGQYSEAPCAYYASSASLTFPRFAVIRSLFAEFLLIMLPVCYVRSRAPLPVPYPHRSSACAIHLAPFCIIISVGRSMCFATYGRFQRSQEARFYTRRVNDSLSSFLPHRFSM